MVINVPTSWDDITVSQYQALNQIDRANYTSDISYTTAVLQVLCGLDSILHLPLDAIKELTPYIAFFSEDIPVIKYDSVKFEGKLYEWIPSFNSLTVGEAISIELPIEMEELTFTLSYDVVMAVMLREKGSEFNADLFNANRIKFGNLPITHVIGMILFFLSGGQTSTDHIKTYSIQPMKTKPNTQRRSSKLNRLLKKLKKITLNG